MATKSSTKKTTKQKHDLVYIMSNSCGWCKKADPIVCELKGDGYDITTLYVMIPEEGQRANELKQKFEVQCGTPLFIDAETGNQVCGFREKDVLEKWAKGEEIPKPPQPKGMPPRPPVDITTAGEEEMAEFKKGYEEWAANNKHLPNVLTFDQAVERIKAGQAAQKNNPNNPNQPGQPGQQPPEQQATEQQAPVLDVAPVSPEQAAQEIAAQRAIRTEQPPVAEEVNPNQVEFDFSEPTKVDQLIDLIKDQNLILEKINA